MQADGMMPKPLMSRGESDSVSTYETWAGLAPVLACGTARPGLDIIKRPDGVERRPISVELCSIHVAKRLGKTLRVSLFLAGGADVFGRLRNWSGGLRPRLAVAVTPAGIRGNPALRAGTRVVRLRDDTLVLEPLQFLDCFLPRCAAGAGRRDRNSSLPRAGGSQTRRTFGG